jgi:hypothetical protein
MATHIWSSAILVFDVRGRPIVALAYLAGSRPGLILKASSATNLQQMMQEAWLLFLIQEAPSTGAGRSRVWRGLKALGAAVLRDGVYVLPARSQTYADLDQLQADVAQDGGVALVFIIPSAANTIPTGNFAALFDRTEAYNELIAAAGRFSNDVFGLEQTEVEIRRALRALQRELAAITAVDYFPTPTHDTAMAAVTTAENAFAARFSPGEPHAAARLVLRLDAAEFQRKRWTTRRRLWVDRVASAWLIKRKIDEHAQFEWLESPVDCPQDAIGFDFDAAAFTHVGNLVTFEVLLHAFGLDDDAALIRMATMVHSLDVADGAYSPEAAGFEAMLTGARDTCANDDDLIAAVFPLIDLLYAGFVRERVPAVPADA